MAVVPHACVAYQLDCEGLARLANVISAPDQYNVDQCEYGYSRLNNMVRL